jgi:3-hydroxyisobutyrate dehydrogenase
MRYGFVGLGHLGGQLALSVQRAGFSLVVHDHDPATAAPHLAAGAAWAETPEALGTCDAVLTCLPSPTASEAVLSRLLPVLREGATWIEMSTC